MPRVFLFLFSICLGALPAAAEFNLTPGLDDAERKLALKTLGLGSMTKNLTTPAPLGTDSGLEVSIAAELIDTSKISTLLTKERDTLIYPRIMIGKGLYDKTDLFFHFIPYTATLGLSEFGGLLRHAVYRTDDSPLIASLVLHANSANFNNQLTSRNIGADLYLGMAWKHVSVFSGFGWARSAGKFVGGRDSLGGISAGSITDSGNDETAAAQSAHFALGTQLQYSALILTLGLDHYIEPVYSVKLGILL